MSAPQKRGFVAFARKRGLSERRAYRLAGSGASWHATERGHSAWTKQHWWSASKKSLGRSADSDTARRSVSVVSQCGYRLAHRELRRSGLVVNHKRVHRLKKAAQIFALHNR